MVVRKKLFLVDVGKFSQDVRTEALQVLDLGGAVLDAFVAHGQADPSGSGGQGHDGGFDIGQVGGGVGHGCLDQGLLPSGRSGMN